ncbi:universal stress protein [Dactylosporangium sp. NPDC005555]|uniref:universal stress protein n=1 Tax=Dactylosporangium sp. NPDC005555 TaxID=3154889 RepID=UPI0033A2A67D
MDNQFDVVVGVDGSPESLSAVEWAASDAARRHRRLHIVHAYAWPVVYQPLGTHRTAALDKLVREAATTIVDDAVARARSVAPQVPVTTAKPFQLAAAALLGAAERADVVVVGSRGRGGFTGLLLGSVSQAMIHHASCPVAVVR